MTKQVHRLAEIFIKDSFLNSLAIVLFSLLTLKALINPCIPWDSWAYHLPFSSYIWNIGGGLESYEPGAYFRSIYQGFPLLGEFLQGFCWKVSGTLQVLAVPHIFLFVVFLYAAGKVLEIKRSFLFFAFMGSPMLVLTYISTYVDLLAALSLALAFMMGIRFLLAASEKKPWIRSFVFFGVFEIVAANIKYQSYLSSLLVLGIFALAPWVMKEIPARVKTHILMLAAFTGALMSTNEVKNLYLFHNPFYPIVVTMGGHVLFDAPLKGNPPAAHYPISFGPLNFLLSATELDWPIRYLRVYYDVSNDTGDNAIRYGPERTGGWGQVFVFLNTVLLALQAFRWLRLERVQKLCLGCFLVFLLATSVFPRCTELRYYLSLPLLAILINLRFASREFSRDLIVISLLVLAVYSMVFVYNDPQERTFDFIPTDYRAGLPPEYVNTSSVPKVCYVSYPDKTPFLYARAVTGQNTIIRLLYKDKESYEENFFPCQIGTKMAFDKPGADVVDANYFSGFTTDGPGHLSMNGPDAAFRFLVEKPSRDLTLNILAGPADGLMHGQGDYIVYANQLPIGQLHFLTGEINEYSFSIPKTAIANNGKLTVELKAQTRQESAPGGLDANAGSSGLQVHEIEIK